MAHYVLICGGRDFDDEDAVMECVDFLYAFYGEDLRIMHGAAKGADRLAQTCADRLEIPTRAFPADWDAHRGKKPNPAGMIRNRHMADLLVKWRAGGHSVQCVAFPGGSGTVGMVKECRSRQIEADLIGWDVP